jgi:hypothetical protein
MLREGSKAYRNGYEQSDDYARQYGQCGLFVVLAGEQAGVLECPQSTNNGELGTPQDGIRLEVTHVARWLGGRKMEMSCMA